MPLVTESRKIASEIDAINSETLSFVRAQAIKVFALVNTPGQQQAILDEFGINAAAAVSTYAAFYAALVATGNAEGLASPDLTVFQPQADGSVIYVAPIVPEPPDQEESP